MRPRAIESGEKMQDSLHALVLLCLLIMPLVGSLLAHACPPAHNHILLRGATFHDLMMHQNREAHCHPISQPQHGTILSITSPNTEDRLPYFMTWTIAIVMTAIITLRIPVRMMPLEPSERLHVCLTTILPLTPPPERI